MAEMVMPPGKFKFQCMHAFVLAILRVGSSQNLTKYKRGLCLLMQLTNGSIAIM